MAVARKLFELCGTETERVFSPFCWRTRMALAHKDIEAETIPWRFTEKDAIAPHQSDKVPVLLDGETSVADSWAIANYLEDTYPDRPSLFGGEGGRAMGRMLNWWGDTVVLGGIFPMIAADIHGLLRPVDQDYFRKTREARLGKTLEAAAANRDQAVEGFRNALNPMRLTLKTQPFIGGASPNYADYIVNPMRLTLKTQPFIGGASPNYADYIVFGPFQWARATSAFKLLTEDDPVYAWREKLLDAFGGMARKSPGYAV